MLMKNAALGLFRRHRGVHERVPIVQCFDLLGQYAPAVFGADGEQPLPHVIAVAAGPKFQRPKACKRRVSTADGLLHRRGNFAKFIPTFC